MSPVPVSTNDRAERIMGRRLTAEEEQRGVMAIDIPCELGFRCPVHRVEWDESLAWSEYNGFLWCPACNRDWPSALCVPVDALPDPARKWVKAGPAAAVTMFLDQVAYAQASSSAAFADVLTAASQLAAAARQAAAGDSAVDEALAALQAAYERVSQ